MNTDIYILFYVRSTSYTTTIYVERIGRKSVLLGTLSSDDNDIVSRMYVKVLDVKLKPQVLFVFYDSTVYTA